MSDVVEPRHTHPLTALTQGGVFALAGLIAGGRNAFENGPSWSGLWGILAIVTGAMLFGWIVGFIRWRYTFYLVSDSELRIDSGPIFRRSRRVPFNRLQSVDIAQPLVARFLQLCELRIESAGGRSSRTTLRYLPIDEAFWLRRLLLNRAHEKRPGAVPDPQLEDTWDPILSVPITHIVLGTALSIEFLLPAALTAVTIYSTLAHLPWLAISIVPAVIWLANVIGSRVIAQWNFRLSKGPQGLRIERGLLSTSSRTIPFDRVQGVVALSSIAWRLFGWHRLEVDVAGYGRSSSDDGVADTTLLPVAKADRVRAITELLIPGSDPATATERLRPPRRAMFFDPIGWRFRWAGSTPSALIVHFGWIETHRETVRHHKAQSVATTQWNVQRWFGLASVGVHLPPGPVKAQLRNLSVHDAEAFVADQVARSFGADVRVDESAAAGRVFGASEQPTEVTARVEPPFGETDFSR